MRTRRLVLTATAAWTLCGSGAAGQQAPPDALALQVGRAAVERDLQVTPPCPNAWHVAFSQARISLRGSPQEGVWPLSVTVTGTMSCDWLGRRMNYRFESDALVRLAADEGGRWSDAGSEVTNKNTTPFEGGEPPPPAEAGRKRTAKEAEPKPAQAGGAGPDTSTGVLRADLKRLFLAQEVYYSAHNAYADGPGLSAYTAPGGRQFRPSAGVRVTIREASIAGWSAEARRRSGGLRCALFVGRAKPIPPASRAGKVGCTAAP